MTADHLGSPRIVTDQTGKVISRHDYLAFGDEVTDTLGNVGGRNPAQGYGAEDDIRKQYTGYEKDEESGLDFAQARYYNGKHGRFTSVDPMTASANVKDPQTFNRYSYVLNSPYKFTDPLGLLSVSTGACGQYCGGSSYTNGPSENWSRSDSGGDVETEQTAAAVEAPPPPAAEQNAEPAAGGVVEITADKTIAKKIQQIDNDQSPPVRGVKQVATQVVQLDGDLTTLNNDTLLVEGDAVRDKVTNKPLGPVSGYMRTVGYVVLDQWGGIMDQPDVLFMIETVTQDSPDAKQLEKAGLLINANGVEQTQTRAVFYDIHASFRSTPMLVESTQTLEFRQYYGRGESDYKTIFTITNKLVQNDKQKTISVTRKQ